MTSPPVVRLAAFPEALSCPDDHGRRLPAALDVVVLGGGVAGLAAALRVTTAQPGATVALLELEGSLGGNAMGGFDQASGEWARNVLPRGRVLPRLTPSLHRVTSRTAVPMGRALCAGPRTRRADGPAARRTQRHGWRADALPPSKLR